MTIVCDKEVDISQVNVKMQMRGLWIPSCYLVIHAQLDIL